MKTLQELKGKTFKAIKTFNCDEKWEQEKIDRLIRDIQPTYYNDSNAIVIKNKEHKNGKFLVTVFCDYFLNYTIDKNDLNLIEKSSDSIDVEYIEKINRYKFIAKNFTFTFEFSIPIYEQVEGILQVKNSGAYMFGDSHGDVIKAGELLKDNAGNIIGFEKRTFEGVKITYLFK